MLCAAHPHIANLHQFRPPIGINLRTSPSAPVGAGVDEDVGLGRLRRPRPVPLASMLGGTRPPPHPAGDHKGPPNPTSSSLAPTDRSASWLTSRLRLMRIGQPRRSPNTHQPHQHPSSSNKDTTRCNQFSTAFIFRLTPLLSLVLVILLHNAPYCSPRILSILCHHS